MAEARPLTSLVRVLPSADRKRSRDDSGRITMSANRSELSVEAENQSSQTFSGFSRGYDVQAVNEDIFREQIDPVLPKVIEGYNMGITLYGVSEKIAFLESTADEQGLYERLSTTLFTLMKQQSDSEFLLSVSMYQIRGDKIQDLLDPSEKATLQTHDDPISGTYVTEAAEIVCSSASELSTLLAEGGRVVQLLKRRVTGLAEPHVVADIRIESKERKSQTSSIKQALLRVVNVAGAKGVSLQRNEGLKNLLNIVQSLASGADPLSLPFNATHLTRLMRPSLAGNALGLVCGFVSADAISMAQNCLNFLNSISQLKVAPALNYNTVQDAIQELRNRINVARGKLALRTHPVALVHDADKQLIEELAMLVKNLKLVKEQSWARKREISAGILAERHAHLEATGLHLCRINANAAESIATELASGAESTLKALVNDLDSYLRDDATLQIKMRKLEKFTQMDAKSEQTSRTQKDVAALEAKMKKQHKQLALKQLQYQKKMKEVLEAEAQTKKLNLLVQDSADTNHLQALNRYIEMKHAVTKDPELVGVLDALEVERNDEVARLDKEFSSVPGGDMLHGLALDSVNNYFDMKKKALTMENERSSMWRTYLEANFRHKAQMERLEEHTFVIFRNYRRHFEDQRQLAENRYRELVDTSVRDSLKLQDENSRLKMMIEARQARP